MSTEAATLTNAAALPRSHVFTLALEDYFHAASLRRWIREETWYRFEQRLAESTRRALDLLDRCGAQATFFVGSRMAESAPDLVREVARRGHEIASRGDPQVVRSDLNAERLREDAARCRELLEDLIGRRVVGYRLANGWLQPGDLWVLDILADCGYLYDSSVDPLLGTSAAGTYLRLHSPWSLIQRGFREVPVSSLPVMGLQVPIVGSGLLRHLPQRLVYRALADWNSNRAEPCVMYFRAWELDPGQPRINAGSLATTLHFRNLDRIPALLEELLNAYRFTSVASHLGIDLGLNPASGNGADRAVIAVSRNGHRPKLAIPKLASPARVKPVTIVIPSYNEQQSLGYLKNTLQSVIDAWGHQYAFRFVFVDDCSTDGTWAVLQELFGGWPDCRIARHERNRGVAATIQTGVRLADTGVLAEQVVW